MKKPLDKITDVGYNKINLLISQQNSSGGGAQVIASRFSRFSMYIERISKNIKRIKDSVMEEFGLRSAHVMCLFYLRASENGLTVTELAKACGVNKAFVSRVTSELLEKNYISREKKSEHAYNVKYILAEKGQKITDRINEKLNDVFKNIDKDITPEKLAVFNEVLAILDRNIEEFSMEENDG
jgi:DNA-binding MarR family transcriptional regulator